MFRDGRGHDADRAGAGDQNVFAKYFEGERRVHGVAKRIKDRGDLQVDVRLVLPDIGHRDGDIFRKPAVRVNAKAASVRTQCTPAGHAVAAATANEMAFDADDVAGRKID